MFLFNKFSVSPVSQDIYHTCSYCILYFSKCEIFINVICYSERFVVSFLDVKSEYIYIYDIYIILYIFTVYVKKK